MVVKFEAFSSELAERIHRPLLRSKRGRVKRLSTHDSATLLLSSEVLAYILYQVDEKRESIKRVFGSVKEDALIELYDIFFQQFPDISLLQGRESRKKKFMKIWDATFSEYGLQYSLPLVQKLLGKLDESLMTRVEYTAFLTAVRIPESKSRHFVLRLLLDKLPPQKLEVLRLFISVLQKISEAEDQVDEESLMEVIGKCGKVIFQSPDDYTSDRTIINKADIAAAESCLKLLLEEGHLLNEQTDHKANKEAKGMGAGAGERGEKGSSRLRRSKSINGDSSKHANYSEMHMRRVMLHRANVQANVQARSNFKKAHVSQREAHIKAEKIKPLRGKENLNADSSGTPVNEAAFDISEANLGKIKRYFHKTPTRLGSKTRLLSEKKINTLKTLAQSLKNSSAALQKDMPLSVSTDPKKMVSALSSPGQMASNDSVGDQNGNHSSVLQVIDPNEYSKYLVGLPREVLDKIKHLSQNSPSSLQSGRSTPSDSKVTLENDLQTPESAQDLSSILERLDTLMSSPELEGISSRRSSLSPSSSRLKEMLAELTPSPAISLSEEGKKVTSPGQQSASARKSVQETLKGIADSIRKLNLQSGHSSGGKSKDGAVLPESNVKTDKLSSTLSPKLPGKGSAAPPPPPPPPPLAPNAKSSAAAPPPPPPPPPMAKSNGGPPPPPPPPGGWKNGGPPPPPPPPGGWKNGGPPPPPPPPGMGKKSVGGPALVMKAAKKMKPLHWQKLHKTKTKRTFWANEREEFGLNVEELENLFSLSEKTEKKVEKKKSNKVHLVSLKRSHNISIELSGMKVDFSKIRTCLLDMDDSPFSLEQLHVLKRSVPTTEEATKLKAYSGDKKKLGSVEQYFMEVISIPRLENRIDSLIYKKTFVSCVDKLKDELSILKQASNQVLTSKCLKLVLEGVLAVGNYLNTGTSRGSAAGFKIASLLKLKDIKGKDRKTSLLHFIVKELMKKNDKVRFFTAEIDKVSSAAKFQKDYVSSTLQQLSSQQSKLKEEILHASVVLDETSDLNDKFRDVMVPFAEDSDETLTCMKSILENTLENLNKMRDFLGEDEGTSSTDIFRMLNEFMMIYDNVVKDIQREEEVEEKRKKAELRAASRKRSQSICVSSPTERSEKTQTDTTTALPEQKSGEAKVRARSMSVCAIKTPPRESGGLGSESAQPTTSGKQTQESLKEEKKGSCFNDELDSIQEASCSNVLEISLSQIVTSPPSGTPSNAQHDSENATPAVEKEAEAQEEEPLAPIHVQEEEKEESFLAPEVSMSSLASDDEDEMIEEAFAGL